MTIGRIPKVDPGATQPQDRKPSPPAGRAGFKTAPSGKDRVPPKPSQPASGAAFKSTAAPPADDPGVQERGRRGACQPASLRILKRHPRLRKATLKDPRRHSGNSRLAHPPGRQDRRQSAKTIIRSNSRKRLRHNPRRKRREAGRKRPVVGASPPQSKSNEQPAPPLARGQFEYHDYATVWQAKAGPTIHRSGPGPRRFYAKTRAREYRAVLLRAGSRQVVPGRPSDLDQRYRQNGHRRSRPTFPRDTKAVEFFDLQITPEALLAMRELPIESFQAAEISGYMQGDGSVVLPESLREIRLGGAIPAMQSFLIAAGKLPELRSFTALGSGIDDTGASALAQSRSVKLIDLSNNQVSAKGAHELLGMLTLEGLDLSDNRIGSNGSAQLSASRIPEKSQISRLRVAGNRDLSEASLHALYRLPLTAVDISSTNISRLPEDNNNRWRGLQTIWLHNNKLLLRQSDWMPMLQGLAATKLSEICISNADLGSLVSGLACSDAAHAGRIVHGNAGRRTEAIDTTEPAVLLESFRLLSDERAHRRTDGDSRTGQPAPGPLDYEQPQS